MIEMTQQNPPFVAALNVTPRNISVSRYIEGETPKTLVIPMPEQADGDKNINGVCTSTAANAQIVVKNVIARGTPTLVVMSKLILTDESKDPSGPRRALLWWEIASAFTELGIPIAEISPTTVQQWLTGRYNPGMKGFSITADNVCRIWNDIPKAKENFVYYVVAQAAAGAFLLGWDTPVEVSDARLGYFKKRAVSLPPGLDVPKESGVWKARNHDHRNGKDVLSPSVLTGAGA
ncbi:hypothetical protein KIH27_15915 [Mycobacterium sp. M1]|uniref:Uncharacterized protein n=1 Tax=Mycolicibacter acidiphilus TaxID=2835306 RepID=A0ABS5RND4_9MYCO|nr:hypothetical protein [Mycolicibacter acidiphilus]MBS9535074.1 hypothetical protein [Mycolicibacter acidiphilus]